MALTRLVSREQSFSRIGDDDREHHGFSTGGSSLYLNIAGSPSWNSTMIQMRISPQYLILLDDRLKVITCGQLFISGAGSDLLSLTLQYKIASAGSPKPQTICYSSRLLINFFLYTVPLVQVPPPNWATYSVGSTIVWRFSISTRPVFDTERKRGRNCPM